MESQMKLVPEEQLPVTDEPRKRKETPNCLGEILRSFMDKHKLKDADVVRGAEVPFTTLYDWTSESVDCQLTDGTLFKVWMYLNKFEPISLEALVYGIGADFEEDEKA